MKCFYISAAVVLVSVVSFLIYMWHNSPIEGLY